MTLSVPHWGKSLDRSTVRFRKKKVKWTHIRKINRKFKSILKNKQKKPKRLPKDKQIYIIYIFTCTVF